MLKILLVSDSEAALVPARARLMEASLHVTTTTPGREALSLAGRLQPDLVVLDSEMSEKHKADFYEKLKDSPRTAHVSVVSQEMGRHGIPSELEELVSSVTRVLRIAPRRHARVPCQFTVGISEGGQIHDGLAENLSEGGLYLKSESSFDPGTMLRLRFELPTSDTEIRALGRVVRAEENQRGDYGLGVEFVDMDIRSRQKLSRFLAAYISPPV